MRTSLLLALTLLAAPVVLAAQAPDTVRRVNALSWTSDRRAYNVGDLITVIVDESTLAVQDRSTSASQDRSSTAGLNGGMRTAGASSGADVSVRTGFGGSSSERGQARRQDRLTAEMTARVVGVEPGGVLKIEGAKSLVIDGREQTMKLSGLVRAADVTAQNAVDSWRIGDVKIAYLTDGKLSQPKKSMLMKILGMVWP